MEYLSQMCNVVIELIAFMLARRICISLLNLVSLLTIFDNCCDFIISVYIYFIL
jgi:hypothetical protein